MTAKHRTDLYYALTEALVRPDAHAPFGDAEQRAAVDAAAFLQAQISALPPSLLLAARVGLIAFRASVRLRYLRGFCHLPLATRQAVVRWWAFGPLVTTRALFRPLRSIALLAYFEFASPAPGAAL